MAEAARKLEYLDDYENYTEPGIKVHNNSQNNINSKYNHFYCRNLLGAK